MTAARKKASTVLLLQTLAEFSSVAIGKAGIRPADIRQTVDAWLAVMPAKTADQSKIA